MHRREDKGVISNLQLWINMPTYFNSTSSSSGGVRKMMIMGKSQPIT